MQLLSAVSDLAPLVVHLVDQTPEDSDVKAGWVAFGVFLALCAAVAFLGWSLSKQLKKVEAAAAAGVYDDDTPGPAASESSTDQA